MSPPPRHSPAFPFGPLRGRGSLRASRWHQLRESGVPTFLPRFGERGGLQHTWGTCPGCSSALKAQLCQSTHKARNDYRVELRVYCSYLEFTPFACLLLPEPSRHSTEMSLRSGHPRASPLQNKDIQARRDMTPCSHSEVVSAPGSPVQGATVEMGYAGLPAERHEATLPSSPTLLTAHLVPQAGFNSGKRGQSPTVSCCSRRRGSKEHTPVNADHVSENPAISASPEITVRG